jgi:hypothetical protein
VATVYELAVLFGSSAVLQWLGDGS